MAGILLVCCSISAEFCPIFSSSIWLSLLPLWRRVCQSEMPLHNMLMKRVQYLLIKVIAIVF